MAKFLITGDPGSGKSALAEALARRGYTAYDTDDLPDVTRLEDTAGRPVDCAQNHRWTGRGTAGTGKRQALRERLASAGTVFVAAKVSEARKSSIPGSMHLRARG